jgi:hypothetical protein
VDRVPDGRDRGGHCPGHHRRVSLAAHWGGGFHWLAAAGLPGIPRALYGARVLLVEIVR